MSLNHTRLLRIVNDENAFERLRARMRRVKAKADETRRAAIKANIAAKLEEIRVAREAAGNPPISKYRCGGPPIVSVQGYAKTYYTDTSSGS